MIEKRCENPHPDLPGRRCNFIARARAQGGEFDFECPRCHGWVHFDFRPALTAASV